jgi:signal transduction histidine kinase
MGPPIHHVGVGNDGNALAVPHCGPTLVILTIVAVDSGPTVGYCRLMVRTRELLMAAFLRRRSRAAAPGLDISGSKSMRQVPAPLHTKARLPGSDERQGQLSVDADLRQQLEERLRFERLLTDLSATFVNVAADLVDAQIERALKQVVDVLGVERGGFGQVSEDNTGILATHSFVVPGYPPLPPLILETDLPWYAEQVRRGEPMRFERLPEDAPAEAVNERAYVIKTGMKSNVTIPLKAGGIVLGVLSFGAFREFRAWPDELVQRLRTLGEILANALARKRADQALHAREESLRMAQDELRSLAGRLLQAQEDERRRIAREMHDDWTQRLAVLAIDAAKLETQLDPSSNAHRQLQEMRGELVGLSEDVHALSRQLHPSILDDLGLVDALRSECASVSRREHVAVAFRSDGVSGPWPNDVALAVYRVAQEALRNVVKHAEAQEARVSLIKSGQQLILAVADRGVGFDAAEVRSRRGLGLSSMGERVRLVRGELSVDSAPGQGTTVTVRVPAVGNDS